MWTPEGTRATRAPRPGGPRRVWAGLLAFPALPAPCSVWRAACEDWPPPQTSRTPGLPSRTSSTAWSGRTRGSSCSCPSRPPWRRGCSTQVWPPLLSPSPSCLQGLGLWWVMQQWGGGLLGGALHRPLTHTAWLGGAEVGGSSGETSCEWRWEGPAPCRRPGCEGTEATQDRLASLGCRYAPPPQASTRVTSSRSTSPPSRRCACWTPPWSFWRWPVSPSAATCGECPGRWAAGSTQAAGLLFRVPTAPSPPAPARPWPSTGGGPADLAQLTGGGAHSRGSPGSRRCRRKPLRGGGTCPLGPGAAWPRPSGRLSPCGSRRGWGISLYFIFRSEA